MSKPNNVTDRSWLERFVPSQVIEKWNSLEFQVYDTIPDFFKEMKKEENFRDILFRFIRDSGMTEVEVYSGANIDRKLFSKIRTSKNGYKPSKNTVIALCISMKLPIEECETLLNAAGYHLSDSILEDSIVRYFVTNGVYNLSLINQTLGEYCRPLLSN